ncbi:PspC domain-containing protein [Demequina sp. NBRC 110056]|uniref:PspC domain-containing protein n=1 Tax=Demequina sp. NBRC 110056 TaxID=1570345 RepID=UPI000A03810B|nr:PspC domain-containing protein [Demequina sp. NBRC 110056]
MSDTPQPQKEAAFFTSIREWGLMRGDNGVVGGVVEGLGERVGMARVPARLITVLAWLLLPGLVMLGYAAAWGLLPDRKGNIIVQNFGRGVTNVGALLGIAVLTLFGLGGLNGGPIFNLFGWDGDPFPWDNLGQVSNPFELLARILSIAIPLAVVAGIGVLIFVLVRRSRGNRPPGSGGPYAPAAPAPAAPVGDTDASPSSEAADAPAASGDDVTTAPDDEADAVEGDRTAAPTAALSAGGATAAAVAPSTAEVPAGGAPQPWEPALLPGDPRAGAAPSKGASAGLATASALGATSTSAHQGTAWQGSGRTDAPASGSVYDPALGGPAPSTWSAGPPTPPPAPPAPRRPARTPGPGKGAWLAFLGVILLAGAVVFSIERAGQLAVSPILAWGAGVTIGLGAILLIVALSGRRLGFLGFLSVVAVLLSVILAGNASEIRENYDGAWGWWDDQPSWEPVEAEEAEPEPETTPIDLTDELDGQYGSIYAAGACTTPVLMESWEDVSLWGDDTATMRLDAVTADTDIELSATYTRVAFPAGTGLEIQGSGETTIVWEDRDVRCYDWSEMVEDEWGEPTGAEATTVLRASNADEPVLTLTSRDGAVIYLEEVVQ